MKVDDCMKCIRVLLAVFVCAGMTVFAGCGSEGMRNNQTGLDFTSGSPAVTSNPSGSNPPLPPGWTYAPAPTETPGLPRNGAPLYDPDLSGYVFPSDLYPMDKVFKVENSASPNDPLTLDISLKSVLITQYEPSWTGEGERIETTEEFCEERWPGYFETFFPLPLFWVVATFELANNNQEPTRTYAFSSITIFLVKTDTGERVVHEVLPNQANLHSSYRNYTSDQRLLFGERREVVLGFQVDGRLLEKLLEEKDGWRFYIGIKTVPNAPTLTPLSYEGWLIDNDKITYLDVE